MGNILGVWRNYAKTLMITLLACCAYTYLNDPHYQFGSKWVIDKMNLIENKNLRESMRIPIALGYLLPIGIKGTFAAIMLFHLIGCDSSYLHSWGSIFAQDVVLPFRKTPPTTQQHLRLLRWSIVFIAVFSYFFGLMFPPTKFILMFFAMTGAIFLGGSGSAIIGGFYSRKGTTAGAYAGMISGSSIAVTGGILDLVWNYRYNQSFFINGQWVWFISMMVAVVSYLVVSLLTFKENFDLDRVLHRGRWAVKEYGGVTDTTRSAFETTTVPVRPRFSWKQTVLGIDEHFTPGDRFQSYLLFGWTMFWFVIFVVFTIWNLIHSWPVSWWTKYWHIVGIMLPLAVGVITTVWFTIGGLRDLRILFKRLDEAQPQGAVVGIESTTETPAFEVAVPIATNPIKAADPNAPLGTGSGREAME
jgi:SSS family solute:Na+ symporter